MIISWTRSTVSQWWCIINYQRRWWWWRCTLMLLLVLLLQLRLKLSKIHNWFQLYRLGCCCCWRWWKWWWWWWWCGWWQRLWLMIWNWDCNHLSNFLWLRRKLDLRWRVYVPLSLFSIYTQQIIALQFRFFSSKPQSPNGISLFLAIYLAWKLINLPKEICSCCSQHRHHYLEGRRSYRVFGDVVDHHW